LVVVEQKLLEVLPELWVMMEILQVFQQLHLLQVAVEEAILKVVELVVPEVVEEVNLILVQEQLEIHLL
jgi:hypothetical protein